MRRTSRRENRSPRAARRRGHGSPGPARRRAPRTRCGRSRGGQSAPPSRPAARPRRRPPRTGTRPRTDRRSIRPQAQMDPGPALGAGDRRHRAAGLRPQRRQRGRRHPARGEYSSSARGVGASKTALMSVSMPASRRRPISWIASNELPPSAKKFSSVPTSSRWRTSAIVAAIGPSAVRAPAPAGRGRQALEVDLSRSVRGRASSTRITELGTM